MKATVQREMRPATDRGAEQEFVAPEVNISETGDGYVLEAEMPGVSKEGIEITLEGTEMTILGHRHLEPLPGQSLVRECSEAAYRRVFELDPAIDTTKISARMEQGILTLSLPKSESVKPRTIIVE